MSKGVDTRIEEWIGSKPGLWWFDSRNSGDPVSWLVHHPLWTSLGALAGGAAGAFFGLFWVGAWLGAVVVVCYYAITERRGALEDAERYRSGKSKHGPWRDHRTHDRGIWVGYMWDHIGDVLSSVVTMLFFMHKAGAL